MAGGLWAISARDAFADTVNASPQGAHLFYLIAFLCLFGYLMYSHFTINSRLDQMKDVPRGGASDDDAPMVGAFSWDDVADESGGLPLFGERVAISRSGLYLVGAREESLLTTLTANMIYQALSLDDISILYVSQRMARDELGRSLLSLEAGTAWDRIAAPQQARLRKKLRAELDKYATSLFALEEMDWTPNSLFNAWHELKSSGMNPAAILVDDPALGRLPEAMCTETLDRLRLVSVKCGVPIFLLASTQKQGVGFWQAVGGERFAGVLEVGPGALNSRALEVQFIKYPQAPPLASFELDTSSGQILVISPSS